MNLRKPASLESLFVCVLVLGFLLRIAALITFGPYEVRAADPYNYVQLAKSLLAGRGLTVDDAVYGRDLKAFYPPVYPLFLAAFGSLAGFSGLAFIVMNGLTDAATALILKRYDVRAAAIYFLWPWNLLGSFLAQKESLLCFFVVALADIAMRNRQSLSTSAATGFGIIAALAALTQPGLLAFPPLLGAVFFRRVDQKLRTFGLVICGAGLVFTPWCFRNWLEFGRFVPLTTAAGLSLAYVVNFGHFPPPRSLSGLSEPDRFRAVGGLAIEHIRIHPLSYVKALFEQIWRAIFEEKFALSRVSAGHFPEFAARGLAAVNIALLGCAALGRNRDYWLLLLVGVLSLAPMLSLEFAERHRYFLLPFVALLAADAISNKWGSEPRKQSEGGHVGQAAGNHAGNDRSR